MMKWVYFLTKVNNIKNYPFSQWANGRWSNIFYSYITNATMRSVGQQINMNNKQQQ